VPTGYLESAIDGSIPIRIFLGRVCWLSFKSQQNPNLAWGLGKAFLARLEQM
jgi:hypothetical protein